MGDPHTATLRRTLIVRELVHLVSYPGGYSHTFKSSAEAKKALEMGGWVPTPARQHKHWTKDLDTKLVEACNAAIEEWSRRCAETNAVLDQARDSGEWVAEYDQALKARQDAWLHLSRIGAQVTGLAAAVEVANG